MARVRESGYTEASALCKPAGPKGQVELAEGVIVTKRHIHVIKANAKAVGGSNGKTVTVKLHTPERSLTFGDVMVRVSESYVLTMYIETDENNTAFAADEEYGEIVK